MQTERTFFWSTIGQAMKQEGVSEEKRGEILSVLIKDFKHLESAIEELEKENEELTQELKKSKKSKTVWDLEPGDKCFVMNGDGTIELDHWDGSSCDEQWRAMGNIFLTEADAEKEKRRRECEVLVLKYGGQRKFILGDNNYYIDFYKKAVVISCSGMFCPSRHDFLRYRRAGTKCY